MSVVVNPELLPVTDEASPENRAGIVARVRNDPLPALFFAGVVVLALALRLFAAIRFPFEQDELYTLIESTDLFATKLKPGIDARPLYYLLQHPLLKTFGFSVATLRFMPVLFGIAGLSVLWLAARRTLGLYAAVTATLLATFSPWHLQASGMARYWSLIFFLSASVAYLLPRCYDHERTRYYALCLACLVAGTLTHPTFVFPMIGVALAVTLVRRDGEVGWRWPSYRTWAMLWGPYAAFLVTEFVALKLAGREGAVQNFAGRSLLATLRLLPGMIEWTTPIVVASAVIGGAALLVSTGLHRRRAGAMVMLGGGSGVTLLMLAAFRTDVYPDYGIAALPLVFLGVGGGVELLLDPVRSRRHRIVLAGAATLVIAAGMLPASVSYLMDGSRFDYRPAYARIEREKPQQLTLVEPVVLQRYYAPSVRAFPLVVPAARLDSVLAAERKVWAVISIQRYGIVGDDHQPISGWVTRHCRTVESWQRPRFDYRMYRVDLAECSASTE